MRRSKYRRKNASGGRWATAAGVDAHWTVGSVLRRTIEYEHEPVISLASRHCEVGNVFDTESELISAGRVEIEPTHG